VTFSTELENILFLYELSVHGIEKDGTLLVVRGCGWMVINHQTHTSLSTLHSMSSLRCAQFAQPTASLLSVCIASHRELLPLQFLLVFTRASSGFTSLWCTGSKTYRLATYASQWRSPKSQGTASYYLAGM